MPASVEVYCMWVRVSCLCYDLLEAVCVLLVACHYHSGGMDGEGQGTHSADRRTPASGVTLTHHELCRIQLRQGTYTSVMDINVRRASHVMCAPDMLHSQYSSPRLALFLIWLG